MSEANAAPAATNPTGALQGLRVLDVGELVAGPVCATFLADFGADVVKLERPPNGDRLRTLGPYLEGKGLRWLVEARNKSSVCIDHTTARGQELIADLMSRADIIVDNHRQTYIPPRWKDWDAFREDRPDTIIVLVSGFGQTSERRGEPLYDRAAVAMSGWQHLTGFDDGPPLRPGIAVADYVSGIFGFIGALLALRARDEASLPVRGQIVDVALYEPLIRMLEAHLLASSASGVSRGRTGNENPNAVPGGTFKTKDDRWIQLSAHSQKRFVALWKLMNAPELPADDPLLTVPGRVAARVELQARVTEWVAQHDIDVLVPMLQEADVAVARVNSVTDVLASEEFWARGILEKVDAGPLGELVMQGVVPRLSETPGAIRSIGPELGVDGASVMRRWLDLSDADVTELEQLHVLHSNKDREKN